MCRQWLIGIFVLLFTCSIQAANNSLNLYVWAGYFPNNVVKQFEHKTGIKVNVAEFDSNETLYAKLKASPDAGYDLILPSSYYVDRMRRQGMLHKIDLTKLSNFKYLNQALLNRHFDPGNHYSIPYFWGTTGIVINTKYYQAKKIEHWSDLWQQQYRNQLLILDDVREAFAIAFIKLGYSINDTNPRHIYQAYLELKKLMPNIKIFNSDAEQNIYIDEDITIGMGWNGDIHSAQTENRHLKFIYPKDGFSVWIDCLAIAKNAPHLQNAYKFLNFIMQPKIAKELSLATGYSSPNLAAVKLMPKAIQHNTTVNPDPKTLKRGQFQQDIGNAITLYTKYWELLKIGG